MLLYRLYSIDLRIVAAYKQLHSHSHGLTPNSIPEARVSRISVLKVLSAPRP